MQPSLTAIIRRVFRFSQSTKLVLCASITKEPDRWNSFNGATVDLLCVSLLSSRLSYPQYYENWLLDRFCIFAIENEFRFTVGFPASNGHHQWWVCPAYCAPWPLGHPHYQGGVILPPAPSLDGLISFVSKCWKHVPMPESDPIGGPPQ